MLLITGITGFLGSAISARAQAQGLTVRGTARHLPEFCSTNPETVICELGPSVDWSSALSGCQTVIHTAARVHVMKERSGDPLAEFRRVNVSGTQALAMQAAEAGVRRFIYVSSVKVNGEETPPERPFNASDAPAPQDPYGISKAEGEASLRQIAANTGMEVVIVRPPLVYGPGVKANFLTLMRLLQRGIPLPLGAVTRNRRSFVALDNLVDLLTTCIEHPGAVNKTLLVSDGEDLSTTDLLMRLGHAMGKPARLIPIPPAVLRLGATAVGKINVAQRLLGNLQVDITQTRESLGWTPPISVEEGFRRAAAGMEPR